MNDNTFPLSYLPLGRKARVKALTSVGNTRRRMLDLGIIYDTEVEALQKARQVTLLPTIYVELLLLCARMRPPK